MIHQSSVLSASILERPIVSGWERPYQRGRLRSLGEAAEREDGGWRAPVSSPGRGAGEGRQQRPGTPHAARHRAHYFFTSNPRTIPMPAAINIDCNGLARMASSRVCSTASSCWRPCW